MRKFVSALTTLVMSVAMACTAFSANATDSAQTAKGSESAIDNNLNIK